MSHQQIKVILSTFGPLHLIKSAEALSDFVDIKVIQGWIPEWWNRWILLILNKIVGYKLTKTMKKFTCVEDIGDLHAAVAEALEIKCDRFAYTSLGRNRTLLMIFFNSSLRTRLSTQKAAMNLGMNVMVLDVNQGAWKLETERGVVMDGDKAEHLLEAIPVMGSYCDIIGVRSFARFQSKAEDYEERVLEQFIRYSGRPVFSMEAATRHPLQSFADLITIEEHKT